MKAWLQSVGQCQGRESGGSEGWIGEHTHRSRNRGIGYRISGGEPGKGITFEM